MYRNFDKVNLFFGKNKDVDKSYLLLYFDQEVILGE